VLLQSPGARTVPLPVSICGSLWTRTTSRKGAPMTDQLVEPRDDRRTSGLAQAYTITYSHVLPGVQQKAVGAMNDMVQVGYSNIRRLTSPCLRGV
jgi:hypothetical protein